MPCGLAIRQRNLSCMTEPLPPAKEHSPLPALIAWLVILCCVSLVMYRVSQAYHAAAEKGITNPSSELQVQFMGKTAVGVKAMLGALPTTQSAASPGTP